MKPMTSLDTVNTLIKGALTNPHNPIIYSEKSVLDRNLDNARVHNKTSVNDEYKPTYDALNSTISHNEIFTNLVKSTSSPLGDNPSYAEIRTAFEQAIMSAPALLAKLTGSEKNILQFIDSFVNAVSEVTQISKMMEVNFSKALNSQQQAQVQSMVTAWNNYQAQVNAEKHSGILGALMDAIDFVINVVITVVQVVEAGVQLGVNPASDAALGAQLLLTVNSAVQLSAQIYATVILYTTNNPNDVPTAIKELASDGLLGLIQNQKIRDAIETTLSVVSCLGGLAVARSLLKNAVKEGLADGVTKLVVRKVAVSIAIGAESMLTTVGSLGSLYTESSPNANADFQMMSGGLLAVLLVPITNSVIADLRKDGVAISADVQNLVDSAMTMIGGLVDSFMMYKALSPAGSSTAKVDVSKGDYSGYGAKQNDTIVAAKEQENNSDYKGQSAYDLNIELRMKNESIYREAPGGTEKIISRAEPSKQTVTRAKARIDKLVDNEKESPLYGTREGREEVPSTTIRQTQQIEVIPTRNGFKVSITKYFNEFESDTILGRFGVRHYTEETSGQTTRHIYVRRVFNRDIVFNEKNMIFTLSAAQLQTAFDRIITGGTELMLARATLQGNLAEAADNQRIQNENILVKFLEQTIEFQNQQSQSLSKDAAKLGGLTGSLSNFIQRELDQMADNSI